MQVYKRFLTGCLTILFLFWNCSPGFTISIPDEQKLNKEFMEMIQEQQIILRDPIAMHMINTVGNHILSGLPVQLFNYTFYLINDDSFNAFASPAANIFVYKGLIFALESIDEFAGIMAHEIAHAASRHVSQSIDRSKVVGYSSMAGMLAGILIGAAGEGEAGSAMTIGSIAAGQSAMLAFTGENESDADQKAISFLGETGYSPAGLLSGLTKMRAADYQGIEGIPDYFKTHPGTGNRIIHIAGLLSDYTPPPQIKSRPETFDFNMVKYRLMGLYGDLAKNFNKVETRLKDEPENPALHYAMGLLYARKNKRAIAITHLKKALAINLFEPMILLELGRVYTDDGQFEKAKEVLAGVEENPIMWLWAKYYLAIAQLESGYLVPAQKNFKEVVDREAESFPRAYYHLANIMSQDKNQSMSHYYLGVYYSEDRDFKNAVLHLSRAIDTLEDQKVKDDAKKRLESVSGMIKRQVP